MVPKKNKNEWRFCVDFRALNKVTRKDPYPLPRIDETLDAVAASSWFSSLDLRSGYWQVPLAPEAKPKTAFVIGGGLWQFKVLPFGLCNAPATFERLMDKVLMNIPRSECVVYLDDILVHGSSFTSALEALKRVLGRVEAAGLKLHPQKCCFMRQDVTFLGHRLQGGGVTTMHDKIKAVRDWPTPTSAHDLKSFLGLASYYRKFVKGFSCIAAPLFCLLQKGANFVWTDECQTAFVQLRKALTEAPILFPPDPALPFLLDTDASNVGCGAVLSHVTPEGDRVVAYYSRTFNKAEQRYCTTRRELLAVVSAIRHFRYYLGGLHFTVRTDHAALQWLMSFKEPEGQLARWIEELQAFDFEVLHRPGARHQNADALSRRPCVAEDCRYCEKRDAQESKWLKLDVQCALLCTQPSTGAGTLTTVDATELRHQHQEDADVKHVLSWVEGKRRPSWEEISMLSRTTKGLWSLFDSLRLCDGVLQRGWKEPAAGEIRWQVVVPKSLRLTVLQAMHGAPGSGHFGVSKTLSRLRQGFYWGQSRRDVEEFCKKCDSCTARKGPVGRSHAPLQQFPAGFPMERVGIDVLGPFPRSEKGNRFILTAMDYFTKWPEAYCLPDQEAETVVDALVEGMFSRLGVPEAIHTDQGRNFESKVFAAMCEKLGSHKTRTTPLHPQSDGLVERFNRTLAEQLAIVADRHQRDWDTHVPLLLMGYRSAAQDSTACSPALLMLGREIRTPAEIAMGKPPDVPRH
uniref:Gypsy retrotransposon integrase-like protein 1 n=1 Tax=Oryzias latipes TaxID=8090 RepID=A0A3P9L4N5_ORYLA